MNFLEYQQTCKETAVYPGQGKSPGLAYVTLGLCGEAGELANKVKKVLRDDNGEVTPVRKAELINELGDVLWYAAQMATELKITLDEVAVANRLKLGQRKLKGTLQGEGDQR